MATPEVIQQNSRPFIPDLRRLINRDRQPSVEAVTTRLSIREHENRQLGAELAKEGKPVGVVNRGVVAIWGDGGNRQYVESVAKIKGEGRKAKPLAATLPMSEVTEFIDFDLIPEQLRPVFSRAGELTARFGSLCFLRIPITERAADTLPPSMVLRAEGQPPILQNWDARGHSPTRQLIELMRRKGIKFPSATSMNITGQPEIVDADEGFKFSREHGIPLFLDDPKDQGVVKGSYTIFSLNPEGVKIERDGNIPAKLFAPLFGGVPMSPSDNFKRIPHPQAEFPSTILDMNPHDARIAMIAITQGVSHPKLEQ